MVLYSKARNVVQNFFCLFHAFQEVVPRVVPEQVPEQVQDELVVVHGRHGARVARPQRNKSRGQAVWKRPCKMQMLTLEEHNSCISLKQKCQRRSGWINVSSRATSSLTINPACVTRRRQCGQTGLARCMNATTQLRHMAECPHSKRTWRGADMHRMHSRSKASAGAGCKCASTRLSRR